LTGKLFDASGKRLIPVHAVKKGRRYRYYISESIAGGPKSSSGSGWRLPGQEIEQTIVRLALQLIQDRSAITSALQQSGIPAHLIPDVLHATKYQTGGTNLIDRLVQRVELQQDGILLTLSLASLIPNDIASAPIAITREFPMQMKRRGVEMCLVIGNTGPARIDQTLIKSIVRAHKWLNDLTSGRAKKVAEIASREGVDKSYVNRVLYLAFLAPDITEAIITGRQPVNLNVNTLTKNFDLPLDWAEQRRFLGFS